MRTQKYQRRYVDKIEDRDPDMMWMECGEGYVLPSEGRYLAVSDGLIVTRKADILLHTRMLSFGKQVENGTIVKTITPSWLALRAELLTNPTLLDLFPRFHRKFEELVAGGYVQSNWTDVILTSCSRDGGYDVAAMKHGRQILDEVKAYKRSFPVPPQIVRAALGLIVVRKNVSQVRVTTTSRFAPSLLQDFEHVIPEQLELRDRPTFMHCIRDYCV